jgi:ATP-dependent Clp protease adaptor protein ClpS
MLQARGEVPEAVRDAVLAPGEDARPKRDEPWRVLIHNDDYTPIEYVVAVLQEVFALGFFRATRIMLTAHVTGLATVDVLPRRTAEARISLAEARARAAGWPLRFSAEPAD